MESCEWGVKYFSQDGQGKPFLGKDDQRLGLRYQAKHISERKVLYSEKEPSQEKVFQEHGLQRPVWLKQSEAPEKG